MRVGEESSWVCFDLRDGETNASINSIRENTSQERTLDTSNTVSVLVITHGVGEGDARWARGTLVSLVNVRSSKSRRFVVSDDVEEGYVLKTALVGSNSAWKVELT